MQGHEVTHDLVNHFIERWNFNKIDRNKEYMPLLLPFSLSHIPAYRKVQEVLFRLLSLVSYIFTITMRIMHVYINIHLYIYIYIFFGYIYIYIYDFIYIYI